MRGIPGRRIVIAGGATGIGAASAERLAEEGASVVVGDVNLAGAQTTAKHITAAGGTALAVEFDLADEASVQALVDRAVEEFGGDQWVSPGWCSPSRTVRLCTRLM